MQAIEMNNTKDVTIYDIARVLNVSPATVSRGLKDHPGIRKDTKKRILDTALKMGYQQNTFASNLRQKRTHTMGVVVPRLNSYFMSTVIAGMEKVANSKGYNLIISQSQELASKETASILTLFNSRVDGVLVSLAFDTRNLDHFKILFNKKIPVVFFDRIADHPDCTNIVIDNCKAGYEVTRHLLEQGCRRIVHIGGSLNRNVYADRFKGYRQALIEKGIAFDPSLHIINTLSDHAGTEAAQKILSMHNLPDGVFTANDTTAVACIRKLKEAGIKIPEDVAVAGFNNDPIANVIEPNLTTVDYPGHQMGEVATQTLINRLQQLQPIPNLNTIVLRHELIMRQSSRRR